MGRHLIPPAPLLPGDDGRCLRSAHCGCSPAPQGRLHLRRCPPPDFPLHAVACIDGTELYGQVINTRNHGTVQGMSHRICEMVQRTAPAGLVPDVTNSVRPWYCKPRTSRPAPPRATDGYWGFCAPATAVGAVAATTARSPLSGCAGKTGKE